MQGVDVSKWKWLAVAALSLASCRAHRELCEGAACSELPAGDRGGAPGDPPAMAGAAGSLDEKEPPACSDDASCDDGRACNGLERCDDAGCSPGETVECRYGTECVEAASELCVYPRPSPWVVATSFETVLGLPLDELEAGGEMAVLARRERTELLTGFDHVWWSPNGQFALVRSFEDRMGSRLHLLRFGAGLPSPLQSIPDLPNWGDFGDAPLFTADSQRVMIVDRYSGSYVVDLSGDTVTTTLGGIDAPQDEAVEFLCADSAAWVAVDAKGLRFLKSKSGGEVSSIPLGEGAVTASPDSRLLAITIQGEDEDDTSVELRPCSAESWVVPLGAGHRLEFSPDSRSLALELTAYDGGVSVLSLADPQSPKTVWTSALASPTSGPWFTPDSRRFLLMLRATADDDPTFHVLDASGGEPAPLGLRQYASVVAMGAQALLAWSEDFAGEPRDLLWQAFGREEEPVRIYAALGADELRVRSVRFDPTSVFVWRAVGEDTEFGSLRFDTDAPEIAPPVVLPGSVNELVSARDRRAILLSMSRGLADGKLFWISYSEQGEAAEPRLLLDEALFLSIQP